MKIAVHITSFNNINYLERYLFLKRIIQNYQKISKKIDIFIHTNKISKKFKINKVKYILHKLENKNPFYLSWMCRSLMEKQKNNYDCFIYTEDDILFTKKNFEYWKKYRKICLQNDLNLGFLRIEKRDNEIFSTDVFKNISYYVNLKKELFAVNDVNNYCAFWIYDNKEFKEFIKTKFLKFDWEGKNMYAFYGIRECRQ